MERDGFSKECQSIGKGNFNSHAHVERDPLPSFLVKIVHISTHTLTWSVTTLADRIVFDSFISTHTLTWSVTHKLWKLGRYVRFQLTRSRGA